MIAGVLRELFARSRTLSDTSAPAEELPMFGVVRHSLIDRLVAKSVKVIFTRTADGVRQVGIVDEPRLTVSWRPYSSEMSMFREGAKLDMNEVTATVSLDAECDG